MSYIDGIAHEDRSILLVSASDKLHNARSIVRYLHAMGENLWQKFNVPKECTLWDYREVVTAFRLNPVHQKELVNKHERIVAEMERLGGWRRQPPGMPNTGRPQQASARTVPGGRSVLVDLTVRCPTASGPVRLDNPRRPRSQGSRQVSVRPLSHQNTHRWKVR